MNKETEERLIQAIEDLQRRVLRLESMVLALADEKLKALTEAQKPAERPEPEQVAGPWPFLESPPAFAVAPVTGS